LAGTEETHCAGKPEMDDCRPDGSYCRAQLRRRSRGSHRPPLGTPRGCFRRGRKPFQGMIARLAELPLKYQPGNAVFSTASPTTSWGALVERVSGMRLGEFLATYIFRPLGMKGQPLSKCRAISSNRFRKHCTGPAETSGLKVLDEADETKPLACSGQIRGRRRGSRVHRFPTSCAFCQMLLGGGTSRGVNKSCSRKSVELMTAKPADGGATWPASG